MKPSAAYERLEERFGRITQFRRAVELFYWDRQTMLPKAGKAARQDQIRTVARHHDELLTDPEVGEWLEAAETARDEFGPWERANLRKMRHRYTHKTAVPTELAAEREEAAGECQAARKEALEEGEFEIFETQFERLLSLTREAARAKAEALGLAPYDALLDNHSRGLRRARIRELFGELKEQLPGRFERAVEVQPPGEEVEQFTCSAERQERGVEAVIRAMGYASDFGRFDSGDMAVCFGHPGDVRIAMDFQDGPLVEPLKKTVHEAGHGFYRRQLAAEWENQPAAWPSDMVLDESQATGFNEILLKSPEYCAFAADVLDEALQGVDSPDPTALYEAVTRAGRGLRRVEGGTFNYAFHIILRFEIEQDLVSGDLEAGELPAAWRQKTAEYLDLEPSSLDEGCLQDPHWSLGQFGYFPTYLVAMVVAAQLYEVAEREVDGFWRNVAEGEFEPLLEWLGENVHSKGTSRTTPELLEEVTGESLTAEPLLRHLDRRYAE